MSDKVYEPHKSSIGNVDANLIAAGCYAVAILFNLIPFVSILGLVAPLIIYFVEKRSQFLKYHSVQASALDAIPAVLIFILWIVRAIIKPNYYGYLYYYAGVPSGRKIASFVLLIAIYLIALGFGAIQIIAALKAYKYTEYKIPVVGGIAEKVSEKLSKVDFVANVTPTATSVADPLEQTQVFESAPALCPVCRAAIPSGVVFCEFCGSKFAPPSVPEAPAYTPPAQPYQPPTQPYQASAQPYQTPAQPYQAPAQPYQPPAAPVYTPPAPPPAPEAPEQTQVLGSAAVCPSCGAALPPGAVFCGGCGNKIG